MSTYDFYLKGDRSTRISLPSVTTIVSAVLAKPQLVAWAYGATVDALSGAVSLSSEIHDVGTDPLPGRSWALDLLDTFSDHELLDEWIRESGLHYTNVATEAAERGKRAHALLSELCRICFKSGEDAALSRADVVSTRDPYRYAVASWWVARRPKPLANERVVFSLRHMYAGRLDLVADFKTTLEPSVGSYEPTLIDLKTRRAGLGIYNSDQVQLDGYDIAARERGLADSFKKVVLLAQDDGTWREEPCWVSDGVFIPVVELYYLFRKTLVE